MTNKTVDWTDPQRPKKMPGWFSWRHKTRDAHDEASSRYQRNRGPAARRARADVAPPSEAKRWPCGHISSSPTHPCEVAR